MRAAFTKPDTEHLFEVAEGQQGYFTSAQAAEAGYARSTHTYHVKTGNWVREHRGIYRLRRYPMSENGQLVLWSLWSRDRSGKPQGVYSHLTALALKELSDANPARLDLTVPSDFRRGSDIPKILVLHKAQLTPSEIIRERGYAVTTPIRAISDLAGFGGVERDILAEALREGQKRGVITLQEIAKARSRPQNPEWLHRLLEDAR
jgi:predicted transcriptional regulator of viral defense system